MSNVPPVGAGPFQASARRVSGAWSMATASVTSLATFVGT